VPAVSAGVVPLRQEHASESSNQRACPGKGCSLARRTVRLSSLQLQDWNQRRRCTSGTLVRQQEAQQRLDPSLRPNEGATWLIGVKAGSSAVWTSQASQVVTSQVCAPGGELPRLFPGDQGRAALASAGRHSGCCLLLSSSLLMLDQRLAATLRLQLPVLN
jgi:hypothetical protein